MGRGTRFLLPVDHSFDDRLFRGFFLPTQHHQEGTQWHRYGPSNRRTCQDCKEAQRNLHLADGPFQYCYNTWQHPRICRIQLHRQHDRPDGLSVPCLRPCRRNRLNTGTASRDQRHQDSQRTVLFTSCIRSACGCGSRLGFDASEHCRIGQSRHIGEGYWNVDLSLLLL